MDYRLGTCTSCNAQFRVPATFTADRAKCKKCAGVVELGPVMGSAEPSARPPAARPAPGPTSRAPRAPEKPVPERPEAAARPVAPPPADRTPAPPPAETSGASSAARSSGAKPAAARARAGAGERKSVREAAAEAASRVQAVGVGGRGRRGEPEKNKTPLWIAAVVLLAGLVAGGWFLLGRDQAGETHAPSEPAAEIAPAAPEHADGTPAEPPAAEPAGDEDP